MGEVRGPSSPRPHSSGQPDEEQTKLETSIVQEGWLEDVTLPEGWLGGEEEQSQLKGEVLPEGWIFSKS